MQKLGKIVKFYQKKYGFSRVFFAEDNIFRKSFKLFLFAPSFCYSKWVRSPSHLNWFAQNKRIGKVTWVLKQLIPYFSIQTDLFMVFCIPNNFDWYAWTHFTRQGFPEGPLKVLKSLRSWFKTKLNFLSNTRSKWWSHKKKPCIWRQNYEWR